MKRGWKLCLAGLVGYPALELCYRGRTHWSMALAGALTLPCLSRLACRSELDAPYGAPCSSPEWSWSLAWCSIWA